MALSFAPYIKFTVVGIALAIGVDRITGVSSVFADESCNLEKVSEQCRSFRASGAEFIRFEDGTRIPNFAAILSYNEDYVSKDYSKRIAKKKLDAGVQIANALDTYGSELPISLQASLLQYPTVNWKAVFNSGPTGGTLEVPWPLEEPKGMASISITAIRKAFIQKIGAAGFNALVKAYAQWPSDREVTSKIAPAILSRYETITAERKQRVAALFIECKGYLKDEILQGRSLTALSKSEVEALKRIDSVQMADPKKVESQPLCSGLIPNAFYNGVDHTLNICPNLYNYPDSAIVAILGHELGHPLDPCISQFTAYDIHSDKLRAAGSDPKIKNPQTPEDRDLKEIWSSLSQPGKSRTTGQALDLNYQKRSVDLMKEMGCISSCGEGTPAESYLFSDVSRCLLAKGFRGTPSKKQMDHEIDEIINFRTRERRPGFDKEADRTRLEAAVGKNPGCSFATENPPQFVEAVADHLGSRVLGRYLKDKKARTPAEKIAPLSFFIGLACLQTQEDQKNPPSRPPSLSLQASQYRRDSKKLNGRHPLEIERIDKIWLSDREVRRYFGCETLAKSATCDHDPKSIRRDLPSAPRVPTHKESRSVK